MLRLLSLVWETRMEYWGPGFLLVAVVVTYRVRPAAMRALPVSLVFPSVTLPFKKKILKNK